MPVALPGWGLPATSVLSISTCTVKLPGASVPPLLLVTDVVTVSLGGRYS